MACIIYREDKKTGTKYAYRSESYRDPQTKKPKSKRTYLGRVDPVTNKIIPKGEAGKRNRSKLVNSEPMDVLPVEISDLISQQREEIQRLIDENASLKDAIIKYKETLKQLSDSIDEIIGHSTGKKSVLH